jgi:hypothetical protein
MARTMKAAAALLLSFVALAHAAEPAPRQQVVTVSLRGVINEKAVASLEAAVLRVTGEPLPAGLIINLDSPGGDGMAAIRLGRIAREHKAHVFVRGRCLSACVFVLAGGVVRSAPDGAVGIHRGSLTAHRPGVGSVPVDFKNPRVQAILDAAEREAAAYFAEMGMPAELFAAMQSVPHADMKRLSREEAGKVGLIGVDPAYAKARASEPRVRLEESTFVSRSLEAQGACSQPESPAAFVTCYRRALQGTLAPE